jgi:hypothetical protein
MLDAAVAARMLGVRTAPAVRLRLTTWFERRKDSPRGPQAWALRALRLLGMPLPAARSQPTTQPWRRQAATRPSPTAQPK